MNFTLRVTKFSPILLFRPLFERRWTDDTKLNTFGRSITLSILAAKRFSTTVSSRGAGLVRQAGGVSPIGLERGHWYTVIGQGRRMYWNQLALVGIKLLRRNNRSHPGFQKPSVTETQHGMARDSALLKTVRREKIYPIKWNERAKRWRSRRDWNSLWRGKWERMAANWK